MEPGPGQDRQALTAGHRRAPRRARRFTRTDATHSVVGGSVGQTARVLRTAPIEVAAGARLGRYQLVTPLGAGAMGLVFEALDTKLERSVALKLIRPRARDLDAARTRLLREAHVTARVSHPGVVAVFDIGTFGDHLFLAMELVRGGTLRDFAERPHTWRRELRALIEVGRGLAATHDAGVVHRDIKPDNVLVATDGTMRIADFGVACELGQAGSCIRGIAGTPAYMAPESFEGVADPATDQFAFAVMAFELLEKRRPFEVETSVAVHLAAMRQGRREIWRRAAIPARLQRAIDRGMEQRPSDRWPSMRALCATLEACLEERPSSARRSSYRPQPRRARAA